MITPSKGKDVRLSLMHEWGHVYLATNYDISFAVTEACRGSRKCFEDIIMSAEGYLVLQLTTDAIVDYVVSKHISEYRNYVAEDVKERAEELLSVFSVGGPTDVTICVTLAYLAIMVDATVSRTLAVKLLKILNRD